MVDVDLEFIHILFYSEHNKIVKSGMANELIHETYDLKYNLNHI